MHAGNNGNPLGQSSIGPPDTSSPTSCGLPLVYQTTYPDGEPRDGSDVGGWRDGYPLALELSGLAYMPGDVLLELSLNPNKRTIRYWGGRRTVAALDTFKTLPEPLRLVGVSEADWNTIWNKLKQTEKLDPCLSNETGDMVRRSIVCLLCPIVYPLLICIYRPLNRRLPLMLAEVNELLASYNVHVTCGGLDVDGTSWSQEMVRFGAGDIPAVNEAGVIARKYRHKLSHQDLDLLTQPSFQVLNDARALGRSESAELPVAEVQMADTAAVELEMASAEAAELEQA